MELNTNFWLTEQEDYPGKYGMKRFNKTLKSMITDGDLPLNTNWDESISPWAINPRSHPDASYACDILNKCWMFPNMNEMIGIAADAPADEDMILRYNFFARKTYYPFMFYCGEDGQGNGWPFPYWPGRIGMGQSLDSGDFTNYKENLWILSKFDYSRLLFLIRVFVSTYGHNNQSISSWHNGSWYDLDSITDEMWTNILAGTKDISAIRFVPYYANNENYPNNRAQLSVSGFSAFAPGEPLDGSASGLGVDAPYTEDFIDYMLTCYAGIGTDDSEGSRGGYPTLSLGNNGYYDSRVWRLGYNDGDWHWHWFDSLKEWADNYFVKANAYQVNGTNSVFWKNLVGNGGEWHNMYYRQYLDPALLHTKDMMREYIITQCAYLGCWFTTTSYAVGQVMDNTNPNAYIGIIEEDGTTRGRYQKGSEIDTDQTEWKDPWEYSPWVPPVDPDPTEYDEDLQTRLAFYSTDQSRGTADYLMSSQALAELLAVLSYYKSAEAAEEVPEGTCVTLFGTTDPLECVSNIILYPVDLDQAYPNWAGGGGLAGYTGTYMAANQGVYVGNTELVVTESPPTSDPTYIHVNSFSDIMQINWGSSIPIFECKPMGYFQRYKSFLDYEPYCSAELYVPFCGSVKIDPELFTGQNVNVLYTLSLTDGSVRADIYRNQLCVDSLTGNMGAQINLSTADIVSRVNAVQQLNATIQAQKANAAKALAGFALGAAATIATAGAAAPAATALTAKTGIALGSAALGAVGTLESAHRSIQAAEYQIKNAEIPFKQLLTGGGFLSQTFEPAIRLVIYRPTFLPGYTRDNFGDYGHTTGFACLRNAALSNFSGLTVCASVDLTGVTCTAKEAEMIKSALKTGVYLPQYVQ